MNSTTKSYINWDKIKIIPNNRLVKSSYIWFILIPIILKLFNKIESPLLIVFNNTSLEFSLPFSWKVFYLSSLIIVIANLLYLFFCPKIIKEFNHFSEYKKTGRNSINLLNYIPQSDIRLQTHIDEIYKNIEYENENWTDLEVYQSALDKSLKNNFWKIYHKLNSSKVIIRYLTYYLYIIGILLFVFIIIQNITFTLKQFL